MNKKVNVFQIAVIGFFGLIGVIAVFIFAGIRASNSREVFGSVTMWGSIEPAIMQGIIQQMSIDGVKEMRNVNYVYRDPRYYYYYLTEALATQTGPDLLIIEHDQLYSQLPKIRIIPFESYPERTYRESFSDIANIFILPKGIGAIPFSVDPLMLYYNTDQFAAAAIPNPPKYWDEMYDLVAKLAVLQSDTTVTRSAIALGEYGNITHAKAIISALILQSGNPIVKWSGEVLAEDFRNRIGGAQSALRYYTEFSNPTRKAYNWNRSLPSSKEMFLSGKLSMYVGYASEFAEMRRTNPNLPFSVTLLPQARTAGTRLTYGKVYGLAIPQASRNPGGAFIIANYLTSQQAALIAQEKGLTVPLRRDILAMPQSAAFASLTYESALISKTWLDPLPYATDRMFDQMIDNITSGKLDTLQAVSAAGSELGEILR
jgi:ABC-type glycerol-3-phosphate transport system substrate-binding protein